MVAKGSFYNSITPTSDGRQSLFTEPEFYDYILAIRKDVIQAHNNEKKLDKVRRKYWSNPKQLPNFIINEETEQSTDIDVCSHLEELHFADLLDEAGEDDAKYFFKINSLAFYNPLEPRKDKYLCNDGKIREIEENDSQIFFAHDRNKALSLTRQMEQRMVDTFAQNVVNPRLNAFVEVHCVMQNTPEHIFTFKELEQAIRQADDRKDNVICVDDKGYIVVASNTDYHVYPVSYSPFYAFHNCVGPYSNGVAEYIIKDLRSLFLRYLEEGKEARYTEESDNRGLDYIVKRTKEIIGSN